MNAKMHAPGVLDLLKNRPKQFADMLLDRIYRVTDEDATRILGNATFETRTQKEYKT